MRQTIVRNVESSVVIQKKSDLVLSAFTDPDHLKNWWGVGRSLIELKKGGVYALVWQSSPHTLHYVSTGLIEEYLPGCQLKINNMVYFNPERPVLGPMSLTVLTTPEKIGTTLTVIQGGYQDGPDWEWYYRVVRDTWPMIVLKIKEYVETLND